ncbi:MAG: tyrosine-protein phosphatase [Anaerolineae bacterium]
MKRHLRLESIENVRDLGGCPTADGKQTRWRAFVRADHFQPWSEATQQALVDYGVRLVIDLRAPHELKMNPNQIENSPHVTYLNIPFLPDEIDLSPRFRALRDAMTDNHEMYTFMLEECKPHVGEIFSTIAKHNAPTTVFHCYAGKDRTGLIAAMLLGLAGTPEDAIIEDYALTGEYLAERIEKVRAYASALGEDTSRFDLLFASSPQTMRVTLDYLRERYGDIPNYLRSCGVSDEHVNTLRAMLVEESPSL